MRRSDEADPLVVSNDLTTSLNTRAAAEGAIPADFESVMRLIFGTVTAAAATLTKIQTVHSLVALPMTKRETETEITLRRAPSANAVTIATSTAVTMATPTSVRGIAAVLRGAVAAIGAGGIEVALAETQP